jgi:5-methyltetrahydrofolate--homocysteine methyltransferase
MEAVFPLVAEYKCAVIAISNDESGISTDPKVRFEVAKRIVQRAATYGIPPEDILVDPLVMPAGAVRGSGGAVIQLVRWIREELGCNTTCGASNVSFGLPDREAINANFMAMLIAGGMPSAITNPLKPEIKKSILAADMLMGHDEDCMRWLKYQRQLAREAAAAAGGEAAPVDERSARRARREQAGG